VGSVKKFFLGGGETICGFIFHLSFFFNDIGHSHILAIFFVFSPCGPSNDVWILMEQNVGVLSQLESRRCGGVGVDRPKGNLRRIFLIL